MFGNSGSVVVGYDLSNEYAQISYMVPGEELGKTVSLSKDEEQYNIPLCLFKRAEVNQWFVGKDALTYSSIEEGEMVEGLWERALIGDMVRVVDDEFDPLALLSLYVRRTLGLLQMEIGKEKIRGIMFTVPELTKRALEVLEVIAGATGMSDVEFGFEGREESIFYYTIHQPKELWQHDVVVYDFDNKNMISYTFAVNRMTKPLVALINRDEFDVAGSMGDALDARFTDIVKETTSGRIVSCAYLLGEGFADDWCKESIKELCRNRRAFKGNNLYSRGACYAMADKLTTKLENRSIIFLGKDKLRANVGMDVVREGKDSYLALLDGGENWFDSRKSVEFIIDEGNTFVLTITPLDGRNVRHVEIVLEGLGEHEPRTVRLKLDVMMESEDILRVNVTDLGFGEFRKATNQMFTRQILLSGNEL